MADDLYMYIHIWSAVLFSLEPYTTPNTIIEIEIGKLIHILFKCCCSACGGFCILHIKTIFFKLLYIVAIIHDVNNFIVKIPFLLSFHKYNFVINNSL